MEDTSPAPEAVAEQVAALAAQALTHRAVQHPYLRALASGELPDVRWALADFARHYHCYSSHFPRYLLAVTARLPDPAHRAALLQNLTEESGSYEDAELNELAAVGVEPAWIVGVPHPELFRRFATALGVTPAEAGSAEADAVVCWRELFLQLLTHGTPAEAVGALGLGTEQIVSTIYQPFVAAIATVGDLAPRDTVFFPLHTAVDDHHQATLQAIACDYARSEAGLVELRRGMLKALQLRAGFWDWLYARALDPARADAVW